MVSVAEVERMSQIEFERWREAGGGRGGGVGQAADQPEASPLAAYAGDLDMPRYQRLRDRLLEAAKAGPGGQAALVAVLRAREAGCSISLDGDGQPIAAMRDGSRVPDQVADELGRHREAVAELLRAEVRDAAAR